MTKRNLFTAFAAIFVSAAFLAGCDHALSQQTASVSLLFGDPNGARAAASRQAAGDAQEFPKIVVRIESGGGVLQERSEFYDNTNQDSGVEFNFVGLPVGTPLNVTAEYWNHDGIKEQEGFETTVLQPGANSLFVQTRRIEPRPEPTVTIDLTNTDGSPLPLVTYGDTPTYFIDTNISNLQVALNRELGSSEGVIWGVSANDQTLNPPSGGASNNPWICIFSLGNLSSGEYTLKAAAIVGGQRYESAFNIFLLRRDSDNNNRETVITKGFVIGNGQSLDITPKDGIVTISTGSTDISAFRITNGGSLTLGGSAGDIVIDGGETADTTNGSQSLIRVEGGTLVIGGNVTLQNNRLASGDGGALYNGGALYITSGVVTMTGGTITGCKGQNYGGGVYIEGGEFTMNGGMISGNITENSGGGVHVQGGAFNMTGGTISGNDAAIGGGVAILGGEFNMSGSAAISNNTARMGGGVRANGGIFTMDGGTIKDNTAHGNEAGYGGGGVRVNGGTFILKSGSITGNKCTTGDLTPGGGIAVITGTFRYVNAEISGNTIVGGAGRGPDVFVSSGAQYATSADGPTRTLSAQITTVAGLQNPQYQPAQ